MPRCTRNVISMAGVCGRISIGIASGATASGATVSPEARLGESGRMRQLPGVMPVKRKRPSSSVRAIAALSASSWRSNSNPVDPAAPCSKKSRRPAAGFSWSSSARPLSSQASERLSFTSRFSPGASAIVSATTRTGVEPSRSEAPTARPAGTPEITARPEASNLARRTYWPFVNTRSRVGCGSV